MRMMFPRFLTFAAILFCLLTIASGDATLPTEEVEALKQIARTLGKTNWNFSAAPCSGERNWITTNPSQEFENAVTCNCSFANNTVCHVVTIVLKGQNLQGTVPPELVKLPFLRKIDLSRNYLNGTIPPEWGSMQLVYISLLGNRVSGTIPKELANISTLTYMDLGINQLSGTIPPEFGNLTSIETLLLNSNNLTGELPGTLAKLTTLKYLYISDNQFLGSIPNFIQNWTNIESLHLQGSGLNGPIPSGIASLTKLVDLRINEFNGNNNSTFPPLGNAKNLTILILRRCKIIGELPDYLGSLTNLIFLDLSFNQISGQIPDSFSGLISTNYIFLTGNFLTGSVPDWMLKSGTHIELSFNQLRTSRSCQTKSIGTLSCLGSFPCPRNWSSLHINCGGNQVEVDNGRSYEEDTDSGGSSRFFQSRTNWAFSSTGNIYYDNRFSTDTYIWRNSSKISGNSSQLYMDARISPVSLTYYGLCMLNGNYTVNLHFAEIVLTDDRTFNSLARRIFDIYIQGLLVVKDFNIEDEAGGVNKPIIKSFGAEVLDNTLEMQFYWAGKGTAYYGPLISAISVEPADFIPPSEHRKGLSTWAIVGIVIAVIFSISLLLVVFCWNRCFKCKDRVEQDLKDIDLHTGSFSLRKIRAATHNFDVANKIGEGGFGSVYKGTLSDGTIIAVKQLSSKSNQGNREFLNEIGMISALQHPNLVKLCGGCVEANQLLLVYEYMENNCLARALFGPKEHQLKLDWITRHNICIGIARGLAYLHQESRLKIVHRDIKATNVLLDKNLDPKISDFGLARLHEEENSHISTRIAGTIGYMAPEYASSGHLTDKADVYSFGIVLLEIVSGKSCTFKIPKDDCFCVLDWARLLKQEGRLMELVDSRLGSDFNSEELMLTIDIALLCTHVSLNVRPSMSTVVGTLEGRVDKKLISNSVLSTEGMKPKEMATIHELTTDLSESQATSTPTDVSGTAFSKSFSDLYPSSLARS